MIAKVLNNIAAHPEEPKYRRVKLASKVRAAPAPRLRRSLIPAQGYATRIAPVPGGAEFLAALGFAKTTDDGEEYLQLSEEDAGAAVVAVPMALELLRSAACVRRPPARPRRRGSHPAAGRCLASWTATSACCSLRRRRRGWCFPTTFLTSPLPMCVGSRVTGRRTRHGS